MHVRVFMCRFTSRQFRSLNEPWFHFSTNKSLLCATFVFRSKKWHFTCLQLDTTVESDPFSVDRVISICSTVFFGWEKESFQLIAFCMRTKLRHFNFSYIKSYHWRWRRYNNKDHTEMSLPTCIRSLSLAIFVLTARHCSLYATYIIMTFQL